MSDHEQAPESVRKSVLDGIDMPRSNRWDRDSAEMQLVRLRDAVTAMRDDVQAVFQTHHCLVCANGSPCNALILLSRIRARADDVLHPMAPESYAEPDPAATLRDAG
jgi:hypothetical protein